MSSIGNCQSANEVLDCFISHVGESNHDEHVIAILDVLSEYAETNQRDNAVAFAKGFVKGGMQMYQLDKSENAAKCPVCGKVQNIKRRICFECGIVFFPFDE